MNLFWDIFLEDGLINCDFVVARVVFALNIIVSFVWFLILHFIGLYMYFGEASFQVHIRALCGLGWDTTYLMADSWAICKHLMVPPISQYILEFI